jgi:serine/threonine-protein kinase
MNLNKKSLVLCVDDEPAILRSLQWLLQREFDVVTAESGAEALPLLENHDFDVIISDQRMPGMTGSEFLREARRLAPRALRILLTGYSDLQAILRSVNDGEVYRFINKPWNVSELPRVVREAALISRSNPAPAFLPEPAPHRSIDAGDKAILVIDDDPMVAQLVRSAVSSAGTLIHVDNLAEAVATLDQQSFSVVIADTRVGGHDTTRLLRMLKERRPEIVTLVLTAASDANEIIALINQGQVFRCISKPTTVGLLRVVIAAALNKHRQLREMPESMRRHAVEGVGRDVAKGLLVDVEAAVHRKGEIAANGGSLFERATAGFRRLFGG